MKLNLKNMASKAKNRLLNKGLRDFYSNGAIAMAGYVNNMNFYNKDRKDDDEPTEFPMSFPSREDRIMRMNEQVREKYILDCIMKYQQEKHRSAQKKSFIN